ncbi:MAG: FAD-binding protein [Planctomycetes bacterium]|nr:FAD-binding protein [Planctomycetota bacterium]
MRSLPRLEPRTPDALAGHVRAAHADGRALLPAGLGTRAPRGALPARADAWLSTRALDGVVHYEPGDLTISVQAGLPLDALDELLRPHRQRLAAQPFARTGSVGGLVASGAEGALALRHGTVRDTLLGARTCHGDGVLARSKGRVVKNVAGYDVPRLLVGSLGTLGVLVEASLRLAPRPARSALRVATYPDATRALAAARAVLDAALEPALVDVLCAADDARPGAPPVPRLLVLFEGGAARVDGQLERLDAVLRASRPDAFELLRDDETLPLLRHLDDAPRGLDDLARARDAAPPEADTNPTTAGSHAPGVAHAAHDVLVLRLQRTPRTLPEALAALRDATAAAGLEATWLARPGLGSATLRIAPRTHAVPATNAVPASRAARDPYTHATFLAAAATLLDAPGRHSGLQVLSAPDALRADPLRVFGPPPPAWRLMGAVKRALDPRAVLAPGVHVGGL